MKERFLNEAVNIGYEICRDAIWHDNKCNWIDCTVSYTPTGERIKFYKNLGGDFYDGVSGIAIFLSRLYKFTGEKIFCSTSKAALSHSKNIFERGRGRDRFGFYSGIGGIVYSSFICSSELDDEEIDGWTDKLISTLVIDNGFSGEEKDIISGLAGVIKLIKFLLSKNKNIPGLYDKAVNAGDLLLHSAKKEDIGISWKTIDNSGHNLTGYAHGAAGIGCSLVDLYYLTKKKIYLDAAIMAFEYEDSFYDKTLKNWPDFRASQMLRNPEKGKLFSNAWCHGAPGILLSRLNMLKITGSTTCLETVLTHASRYGNVKSVDALGNLALCHGLSGNAQILQIIGQYLHKEEFIKSAELLGMEAISRFQNLGYWPSGLDNKVQTIGFMNGTSGIANFLLNLYSSNSEINGLLI